MKRERPIVLGITGASGSILGLRLLKELLLLGQSVDVILTNSARVVMQQEVNLTLEGAGVEARKHSLLEAMTLTQGDYAERLNLFSNQNIGAAPASGTYLHKGMVIAPCSMGTVSKIAQGTSDSLLLRAADVTLKEHRPLILLPRETPFNAIHLENMLKLSRLGVHLIPPMLSFYHAEFLSMEGQLRYTISKVLDHLMLDHTLHTRWEGLPKAPATDYTTLL
jgi:flavin prenyltransferase